MAPPPNATIGLLNLGGRGVLLPTSQPNSSPGRGFLVPGRSVSVLPLRWGLVRKKGRALDSITAGAVASGEAGAGSSELRHIEKELTFSPTFTDYVKIMESVKLDRSKNLEGGDSDGRKSRRRFMGDGDASVVRRADMRSGAAKNKLFERGKGDQRDRSNDRGRGVHLAKNGNQKNVTRFVEKRAQDDVTSSHGGQGKVEQYVQRRIVQGDRSEIGGNGRFASHEEAKDTGGSMGVHQSVRNKQAQSVARKHLPKRETFSVPRTSAPPNTSTLSKKTESKMGKERFISTTSSKNEHFNFSRDTKFSNNEVNADGKFQRYQRRVESLGTNFVVRRFGDNAMDCKKPTVGKRYDHMQTTPEHDGHSIDTLKFDKPEIIHTQREENVKRGQFVRRDAKAMDFDDRAAFKTFEVFTDVRNRPRVLRMEMEERIQKLASRLNATDVNTPEWKFSKMIHDAKIKFSDHSILRIVQMLGRFGNWKRVLQVVEWLQSRERFKSYKSRYIYTTVLDVLGKAKKPFEALNVFYTMQNQLSSYPDMAAYHCIAVTLGQAGLVKELFDVIDCMHSPPRKKFKVDPLQKWDPRLEPDLIVYNAVLNACVQQKQWEGAFWVLQQLKEKNIRPTNTTYGLVMEVMLVCGKYNLVYEFFNKVEKLSIPGALNYKVLINALWREGKIDEAVMVVEDMENRGIVGSASLYYDLARCLCSRGRCKEALLQVEKICKVANKPLVVTYTGLIQTCIDNGSMENAKYIFNEMCNYCSPNNVTCNIMLKSYLEHGMFEDAKDLLQNILNRRIRSKVDPSQIAIADKFTFNTFMEACAEAKRWNDFEYAFREMLSKGYHFDGRRHLRMVLDAYRNGKEQLLHDIWRYLCHHGRVPPAPLIMERFCLKLIQGDTTGAISCVSRFQESKIRSVSSMSWFNLLTRNADHLKEENITKLVHELNKLISSSTSSDCLYQNILSSCTTFLSGAVVVEKAHFDQQIDLHNS
ncbi:pentatricopeptide repeat-containing protein At1g30610, chloroplastic [Phragmites australis]|uniref:pentatricopeptide repeat-containing protein At1g30610, chloroplastic n=1 Tax=Phragmites australis TaxID=29695 RepID=UPI002D7791BA|nr:pentatricopeptide repeat-containing protein At1g30610, chloroplastic [Phragmites australis]